MPIDVSSLIDTITLENCLAVSMKAEYRHTMYNFSPSIDPTETCIWSLEDMYKNMCAKLFVANENKKMAQMPIIIKWENKG